MLKRTITVSLLIVGFFLITWAVVFYRQVQYFNRAEIARSEGRQLDAIAMYEATIRMYTPFSRRVRESVTSLLQSGKTSEQSGNLSQALMAYQSLKTSLFAVRSFYEPFKTARDQAEQAERRVRAALAAAEQSKSSPGSQNRTDASSRGIARDSRPPHPEQ